MIVGMKDASKLLGISIITCCAVFVCTMFLNYYLDVISIKDAITTELAVTFYHAQVSTAKVVCFVTGGCLLATSIIMLVFYIKHYIDIHKKELGILKALGYSNWKISKHFYVFGMSALIGTLLGLIGAYMFMPVFYELQNADHLLPDVVIHFHLSVFLYFVIIPTILFSILAIVYTWYQLNKPVINLLKDHFQTFLKIKKYKKEEEKEQTFINDLKKTTLKSKKILAFFMIFASFCFSSMTQMSFSMKDLSSEIMGAMMLIIGLVLAFTTLFIAITTVIKGNTKTIAMMRIFGYSQKECCKSILGVYKPLSYIGFLIGTIYQYILLRIMVDIVFAGVEGVPIYKFDFPMMLISLLVFIIVYEILMYRYSEKIKKISVKEIMIE